MAQTATLVETLLPRASSSALRNLVLAVAATLILTLSAKVQVPLIVPMTLQSLVVLVIGAAFGWRLGAGTLALYLLEGAVGMPVFAGTPEKGIGLSYMMGPTGGYLLGFIAAAMLTGFMAERGFARGILPTLFTMALGHAVIFAFGFAWLATLMGAEKAFAIGVAPFFAATIIKTLLGAALLPAAWWAAKKIR